MEHPQPGREIWLLYAKHTKITQAEYLFTPLHSPSINLASICMQVRKQQLELGHGTIEWFQIGKGVRQGYILSFI